MKDDNLIYKIIDTISGVKEFKFLKIMLECIMLHKRTFKLKLSEIKCIKENSKLDIVLELLEDVCSLKFDECLIEEFINLVELEKSKLALKTIENKRLLYL